MKFIVFDGNSILNRAFYGIRMLTAPDGTVRTTAVTDEVLPSLSPPRGEI